MEKSLLLKDVDHIFNDQCKVELHNGIQLYNDTHLRELLEEIRLIYNKPFGEVVDSCNMCSGYLCNHSNPPGFM